MYDYTVVIGEKVSADHQNYLDLADFMTRGSAIKVSTSGSYFQVGSRGSKSRQLDPAKQRLLNLSIRKHHWKPGSLKSRRFRDVKQIADLCGGEKKNSPDTSIKSNESHEIIKDKKAFGNSNEQRESSAGYSSIHVPHKFIPRSATLGAFVMEKPSQEDIIRLIGTGHVKNETEIDIQNDISLMNQKCGYQIERIASLQADIDIFRKVTNELKEEINHMTGNSTVAFEIPNLKTSIVEIQAEIKAKQEALADLAQIKKKHFINSRITLDYLKYENRKLKEINANLKTYIDEASISLEDTKSSLLNNCKECYTKRDESDLSIAVHSEGFNGMKAYSNILNRKNEQFLKNIQHYQNENAKLYLQRKDFDEYESLKEQLIFNQHTFYHSKEIHDVEKMEEAEDKYVEYAARLEIMKKTHHQESLRKVRKLGIRNRKSILNDFNDVDKSIQLLLSTNLEVLDLQLIIPLEYEETTSKLITSFVSVSKSTDMIQKQESRVSHIGNLLGIKGNPTTDQIHSKLLHIMEKKGQAFCEKVMRIYSLEKQIAEAKSHVYSQ